MHVLDGFQRSGQRSKGLVWGTFNLWREDVLRWAVEAVVFEQGILQIYFVRAANSIIIDPELAT